MFAGLTIATWIKLAPRIVALIKFFVAMVIGYSILNKTDPITTALNLLENIIKMVPQPKKFEEWTREEIEQWHNNADGSGMGNNAP